MRMDSETLLHAVVAGPVVLFAGLLDHAIWLGSHATDWLECWMEPPRRRRFIRPATVL